MRPENGFFLLRPIRLAMSCVALCVLGSACALAGAEDAPGYDGLTPEMKDVINDAIGDASVIALAESSHFLTEFHEFGTDASRYLIEEHGVRLFVLETMWAIEENIMSYIDSDMDEIPPQRSMYLNAFNSSRMRDFLLWIRAWNRDHPHDRVIVSGYQPEQPVTDATAIREFFEASSVSIPAATETVLLEYPFFNGEHATDLDSIIFSSGRYRRGETIYSAEQRREILTALNTIDDLIIANFDALVDESGLNSVRELQMHVLSLETSVGTLTYAMDITKQISKDDPDYALETAAASSNVYEHGDAVRAKIFLTLRDTRHRGRRAIIWMHNWHAAKRAEELRVTSAAPAAGDEAGAGGINTGTLSVGSRLFRVLGPDYVVIASLTRCAGCEYDRTDSLEDALHGAFGDTAKLIDLQDPDHEYSTLPLSRPMRGFAQNHDMLFHDIVLDRQFDALLYIPSSGLTIRD